jgi:hypothetical protein
LTEESETWGKIPAQVVLMILRVGVIATRWPH